MSQPNFVIVIADQLRADAVGALGSEVASTPNLDALAARGATFTNAFVQHTVCSPSRASFLTGWYPHVRGHRSLSHLLRPEDPSMLKLLREDGYHVAHVGFRGDTWAPGATEVSCDEYGWDEMPTANFMAGIRGLDPDDAMARAFYVGKIDGEDPNDFDEACCRTAEHWLDQRPDSPWVLYVPLISPHCPFGVAEPWFSMHDRTAIPKRRPVGDGHQPMYMQQLRDLYGTDRLSDDDWREIAATYHGMVSRMDSQVGRILDALGDDPNTVVLFFSDHGEYLGDYDLIEKWPAGLHDCLARDPLIIAGAGVPVGVISDAMVEMVDIVPTVYEMAGIDAGYTHFGKSLLPLFADPDADHREYAFTEGGFTIGEADLLETSPFPYDLKSTAQHQVPESVGKAVAIRSKDWTYIWRLYEEPELYDRHADADELHNVAGRPEHAERERVMRDAMLRWMVETSDVFEWEPDPRRPQVDLPAPGVGTPAPAQR